MLCFHIFLFSHSPGHEFSYCTKTISIVDNPIGPRKVQIMEAKQMRKNISKTINQTLEDRLVSQVSQDGKPLAVIGRKAAQEAKAEKGKKGKK